MRACAGASEAQKVCQLILKNVVNTQKFFATFTQPQKQQYPLQLQQQHGAETK